LIALLFLCSIFLIGENSRSAPADPDTAPVISKGIPVGGENTSGSTDRDPPLSPAKQEDPAPRITPIIGGLLLAEDVPVPPPTAEFRVIHLAPDAPAVDTYMNGTERVFQNVAFQQGTQRTQIPAGLHSMQVTATGDPPEQALLNLDDADFAEGIYYTGVLFGTLANLQGIGLEDDLSNPGPGMIRARMIHTALDVGVLDFWEVSDPTNPVPLYFDLAYGDVGDYGEQPAGAYTLAVYVDKHDYPAAVFHTGDLSAGSIINVFVVKDATTGFLLAQFQDDSVVRVDPMP